MEFLSALPLGASLPAPVPPGVCVYGIGPVLASGLQVGLDYAPGHTPASISVFLLGKHSQVEEPRPGIFATDLCLQQFATDPGARLRAWAWTFILEYRILLDSEQVTFVLPRSFCIF